MKAFTQSSIERSRSRSWWSWLRTFLGDTFFAAFAEGGKVVAISPATAVLELMALVGGGFEGVSHEGAAALSRTDGRLTGVNLVGDGFGFGNWKKGFGNGDGIRNRKTYLRCDKC